MYKLLMKHRLCYIVNMDSLCIWVKIILTIQWGSVDTNAMQYSKQDERQILYGEIQCRFKRIVKKRPKCTSPAANCYHPKRVSPKNLRCFNVRTLISVDQKDKVIRANHQCIIIPTTFHIDNTLQQYISSSMFAKHLKQPQPHLSMTKQNKRTGYMESVSKTG